MLSVVAEDKQKDYNLIKEVEALDDKLELVAEDKEEDYEQIEKIAGLDEKGIITPADCKCNGWAPDSGEFKGVGSFCATGRSFATTKWCYVNENYEGPGYEFVKPSSIYDGKYYSPCEGTNAGGRCKGVTNAIPPQAAAVDAMAPEEQEAALAALSAAQRAAVLTTMSIQDRDTALAAMSPKDRTATLAAQEAARIRDLMKTAVEAVENAGDTPENAMVNLGSYPFSEVDKWHKANDCSFVHNDPAVMATSMVVKMRSMAWA